MLGIIRVGGISFVAAWLAVATVSAADKKVYGEGVTEGEVTSAAAVLANPEAYEGRVVRVRGVVVDVCRKMGCWIEVESVEGGRIQVKVEDGVIVFPETVVGKGALAEGIVEIRDLTRERYVEWLEHVAEEQGRPFDPDSAGDPPYRIVRLCGLGAEIEE
jgi:hypothetical protein